MVTAVLVVILELLHPTNVFPQQAVVPLQLSFSDPGARSMGFGGAFVALADDATAAFANPAGLTQLLKPEISVEARGWSYSTPYAVSGRVDGIPSGLGIDTIAGVQREISDHDDVGLSFVAVAFPAGKWSFAFYRHEYANLEFAGETQGLFGGGSSCCQVRWWDSRWTSELDIVGYGASAAYRVGDRLDVGLSAVYYEPSINARVSDYLWDDDTEEAFFSSNSYLPERLVRTEELYIYGTDWTMTVGLMWRFSDSWRLGFVYRQGVDASIGTRLIAGPAGNYGVPPGEVVASIEGLSVEFPDIFGIGVVYRHPDGNLTASFQWDRVEYSDIPKSLQLDDQTIDDTNEFHLGVEYVFLDSSPIIALRFGTWYEPYHQMRATIDDSFLRAVLPDGSDEIHFAAGLGIAMKRFQIDLAVDAADRVDTLSLSAILNF